MIEQDKRILARCAKLAEEVSVMCSMCTADRLREYGTHGGKLVISELRAAIFDVEGALDREKEEV